MKAKVLFFGALSLLFMVSCVSTSGGYDVGSYWFFEEEKTALDTGAIKARQQTTDLLETIDVGNFNQISWLYSILDNMDMHETMTLEEKKQFMDGLFENIPAQVYEDVSSTVAVGNYFGEGENLVYYTQTFSPSEAAPAGSSIIVFFTGNYMETIDSETEELKRTRMDGFISMLNSDFGGILFENGQLVYAAALSNAEEYAAALEMGDSLSLINLIDSYTKDEIPENDSDVPQLYEQLSDIEDPTLRTVADLNYFQYLVSIEDLEAAGEQLEVAQASGAEISEPSFRRVLDTEAPQMLALMEYLLSKGDAPQEPLEG